jgi:hypothetical protein
VNTLHYTVTAVAGQPTTDAQFAIAWENFFAPLIKACVSTPSTFNGVVVQLIKTPLPINAPSNLAAGVCSGGAITTPNQVAAIIRFLTNNGGKKYRGRIYMPFVPTSAVQTNGIMLATFTTTLSAFANQLLTQITFNNALTGSTGSVTVQLVIRHALKKGQAGPEELPTRVTTVQVSNRFATQRKRGLFGRLNISPV